MIVTLSAVITTYFVIRDPRRHSKPQHLKERRAVIQRQQTNDQSSTQRIIYSWDRDRVSLYERYRVRFSGCQYSNCILNYSDKPEDAINADVVLVAHNSHQDIAKLTQLLKDKTSWPPVWIIDGQESPRYHWLKWRDLFNDFDGAITYTKDALLYYPYGHILPLKNSSKITTSRARVNYAANKTKGAFSYVSNCLSAGYSRLHLMKQLREYIDIDIYGGCTHNRPCSRGDWKCEARLHSQYHFYLSFENSLCTDYITEKFWKVLSTDGYYIPVAVGGLTTDEYTNVAPPNSFLHLYNFSSVAELGGYMRKLMNNPQAFNKYNKWRDSYGIEMMGNIKLCKLCEIANFPSKYKTKKSNIAEKFNDQKNCREIPQFQPFWSSALNVLL